MAHTGSYNIGVPGSAVIIPDQSHVINGDGGLLAYVIYASQAGFAEVQLWRPTGGPDQFQCMFSLAAALNTGYNYVSLPAIFDVTDGDVIGLGMGASSPVPFAVTPCSYTDIDGISQTKAKVRVDMGSMFLCVCIF